MWRLTFPVLGAILFGAHLYFWGNYLLLPIPLILLILLFIPFRPVCWLWEICLICFGVEWLISPTNFIYAALRQGCLLLLALRFWLSAEF